MPNPKPISKRIAALAHNLQWAWNPTTRNLFESLDPQIWHATNQSPLATLRMLPESRLAAVNSAPEFASATAQAEKNLSDYLKAKTWFQRTATPAQRRMTTAYFCMEYALHESIPLYAGGLGVLAGDHLKSASDLGIPLVAVGVLWAKGYYQQRVMPSGEVRVRYPRTTFDDIPITNTRKTITLPIGSARVTARIWTAQVGRIPLVLLDTDIPANTPKNRGLTHHLYQAGSEIRIRQEILLGIGGLLALDKLGIKPTVFHLNEGHAAFCALERIRRLVKQGNPIDKATQKIRRTTVFTTHTPVPEGNDRFAPAMTWRYLKKTAEAAGFNRKEFLALGREDPADNKETFCMTVLALRLAERCNGVAELHGETARKMWQRVFNAQSHNDVPIGHVTNGVHPETWLADEARPFYAKHFKPKWNGAGPADDWWKHARKIPAAELWDFRQMLRRKLISDMRKRVREQTLANNPAAAQNQINALFDTLDENALTIGFARRFALYKRAPLVFHDTKRLAKILNSSKRPVQIIFAGKAHPADDAGHAFVAKVKKFTERPEFKGRVFLIENYDMAIGRMLTQGADLWLNTPLRPNEASGTSGMKPPLHAGLNCSILDGWWPEGFNKKNGWTIGNTHPESSRAKQDAADAESLYTLLEKGIVPAFYDRNASGIPVRWAKMMGESMASVCARFSTHRMLAEYAEKYYLPAYAASRSR